MAGARLKNLIQSDWSRVAAIAGVLLIVGGTQATFAATRTPATTYTLKNLSATVTGTSVTATATVAASVKTTAQYAGICVRDANDNNFDFDKPQNVVLTTSGTVLNGPAQTLPVGNYNYFACVAVKNVWYQAGNANTFTVSKQSTPATTYTLKNLSATVTGTSVTATATVAASTKTTAQSAGICVNDVSNNNFNFPMSQNVALTTSGTVLNGPAQTLVPGTYTYYACIVVQSVSYQVGDSQTFTVNAQAPVPVTYTLKNLSATVTGTSVTATATVAASVNTTAQSAGVCVRDADGNNFDFNQAQNVVLTTSGTVLNGAAQTLNPGTYTYYACVEVQNVGNQVGGTQSFTVASDSGSGTPSLPYATALSGYSNLSQSFTAQDMISGNWAQKANDTQEGGGTCSTANTTYDAINDAVKLSTNGLPTNQSGASCAAIRSAATVPTKNTVIESKIQLPGNSSTSMLDWASFWTDGASSNGVENWPVTGEVDAVETQFGQSYVSIHCGCMQDYNSRSGYPTEVWTTEPSGWEDKDTTYAKSSAANIGPGWTVVDIAYNSDGSASIYYNGTLYITVPASVLTWNTGSTYVNWGISGAYAAESQSSWPMGSGAEEVQYLKVFTK